MGTDRPRPGGLWRLGALTAFPGRLVVVAGRVPTGGHFVMLVGDREPEARLNDLAITDQQIRWFEPAEAVRCVTAVAPVPVLSDDLERRVAVVTRGTHDRIVAALLAALVPIAPTSASVIRDTPAAWEEEVTAAGMLHQAYHDRVFATEPHMASTSPIRQWMPLLTGRRLRRVAPQSETAIEVLFAHDDVPFASMRGVLGETTVELEIDLGRAGAADADTVRVELLAGGDVLGIATIADERGTSVAEATVSGDVGRARRILDVVPEELLRDDLTLRVLIRC